MSQPTIWDDLDFLLGDLQGSQGSPAYGQDSTTEGLQHSVPAASQSWADLDDEELDDLDDLQEESMTEQQRLCRQRYLALEAMDAEEPPVEEPDNYDDDFDFSEEEHPFEEASDNHQEVESVGDPEEDTTYKVTEHGIRYKVVERLWNTYDVQHRHPFLPLIPRHDNLREYYANHKEPEFWYHRPGRSSLHQVLTAAIDDPVMAPNTTLTDNMNTDFDATTSEEETTSPLQCESRELTAVAENPFLAAGGPCNRALRKTVNTDIPAVQGEGETVHTENLQVEERLTFRRLFFVRVCAVLDNARKVADATLELIR